MPAVMRARTLVVGVVPVLWLILAGVMQNASGRASPTDPDYYYLLSALDLAEGRRIGMFHHPGTTAEVFGALMLRAAHLVAPGEGDLQVLVLRNPESYLALIHIGSSVLIALGLLIVGAAAVAASQSAWLAVWLQLSAFLAPVAVLEIANRFKAEPFLLFASLLFIAVTVRFVHAPKPERRSFAIAFAVVCGFGLATKFTFVAMAIAPLIMLTGLVARAWFAAGTAVATIFFTLPIANSYGRLAAWMYDVSSHTGLYGEGAEGFVDVQSYRAGFAALFARNLPFDVIVIAGVVALLAAVMFSRDRRAWAEDRELRVLGGVVLSQIAGFLLAAKHGTYYTTDRYLIGSACLLGVTLWLTVRAIRRLALPGPIRSAAVAAVGVAVIVAAVNTARLASSYVKGLQADARARRGHDLQLSVLDGSQFQGYARIYDQANGGRPLALFQASYYSVEQVEGLTRAYPLTFFCLVECSAENWETTGYYGLHHTRRFTGAEISALSGGRVVLIYGMPPRIQVAATGRDQ